ncbi:extracellular solute-binding protein [Aliihoeflea sp. PC F10.4]
MKMGLALTLLAMQTVSAMAQGPVAGEVAEGSLDGQSVTFVSYGGIYQDGQLAALDDFVEKSGVELYSDGPTELAKIQAQVQSGNVMWDVVDTGDTLPYVHCGTIFQKLDFSRLDVSKIPEGQVGECSVPAMNYGVVLVYKNDVYGDNPPKGWADFFDTENFPGTRAIPGYGDPAPYLIELALLNDGVAADELFPADIDRGLDKLRGMRDDLILWTTGAQSQQIMEAGEADMAIVWSGRGMAALKNGANYTPVWNDWVVVMDQLTIPVGAPNVDAAYALINAYLGKEPQEILTEKTSYSPINLDAKPEVDAQTAEWMTNTPDRQASMYRMNLQYWVEHNTELTEKWGAFIAGG